MTEDIQSDSSVASRLRAIARDYEHDSERAHSYADTTLLNLLKSLGYTKTVRAFEKVNRWYA